MRQSSRPNLCSLASTAPHQNELRHSSGLAVWFTAFVTAPTSAVGEDAQRLTAPCSQSRSYRSRQLVTANHPVMKAIIASDRMVTTDFQSANPPPYL